MQKREEESQIEVSIITSYSHTSHIETTNSSREKKGIRKKPEANKDASKALKCSLGGYKTFSLFDSFCWTRPKKEKTKAKATTHDEEIPFAQRKEPGIEVSKWRAFPKDHVLNPEENPNKYHRLQMKHYHM